jgi:8-oxo-dGTP pyrophosphatase MutT (NUDIX family)
MTKALVRKVLVYCVRDGQLLVFRHVDYSWEDVGIQVPAGSIKDGETVEAAALRELTEETGQSCFAIDGILGTAWYDMSPYRCELQERYFVLVRPTATLPDRWMSQEDHDGKQPPTRLECFWIPLEPAHVLQAGQSAMIWRLVEDVESHPGDELGLMVEANEAAEAADADADADSTRTPMRRLRANSAPTSSPANERLLDARGSPVWRGP